jgi:hypothetical protein
MRPHWDWSFMDIDVPTLLQEFHDRIPVHRAVMKTVGARRIEGREVGALQPTLAAVRATVIAHGGTRTTKYNEPAGRCLSR